MTQTMRANGPEFMELSIACSRLLEDVEAGRREADPELIFMAQRVVDTYARYRKVVAEALAAITGGSLGNLPIAQAEREEAAAVAEFDQLRAELFDLAGQIAEIGGR